MSVVEHAINSAKTAVAVANAHDDPAHALMQQLKQHPSAKGLMDAAMKRMQALMDVIDDLPKAVKGSAIESAMGIASGGNMPKADVAGSAVNMPALKATTAKLVQLADISDLLAKLEALCNDAKFMGDVNSRYKAMGQVVDIQTIRSALKHVSLEHIQPAQKLSSTAAMLKSHPATAGAPEAHECFSHVAAEIDNLLSNSKPHLAKLLTLLDTALAKAFA